MKKVSKIDSEIRRIQNYIKRQQKKFGSNLIVDKSLTQESLRSSRKSQKAQLKYLQSLSTKVLQQRLQVQNTETGEIVPLYERHKQIRSEAQKLAKEAARQFAMGDMYSADNRYIDVDTGEIITTNNPMAYEGNLEPLATAELPIKENIEINNAGEAMAKTIGETWWYKDFYKNKGELDVNKGFYDNNVDRSQLPDFEFEQYAQLRTIVNDRMNFDTAKRESYNAKMRRQANFMNNWLNKLEETVGLGAVIEGLHRFLGQNSVTREDIFYRGQFNYEFAWRLAEALDMSDSDRERLKTYLEEDAGIV